MDSNPQLAKPISDDQELAKVLAGINQQTEQAMQFETTPVTPAPSVPITDPVLPTSDPAPQTDEESVVATDEEPAPAEPTETPSITEEPIEPLPTPTVIDETPTVAPSLPSSSSSTDLTSIKKDALNDLRPLVDKLEIAPEEKFDTYLLLIRSTDDKSLIAPAYAAAQSITDEARKAQALLDVIKEIDYLSNPPQ